MKDEHLRFIPHSGSVCCFKCGDSYHFMPCTMGMMNAVLKQYRKEHLRCKPSERGADLEKQVKIEFNKLPPDQQGVLEFVMPKNATMGEKIAHEIEMDLIEQCLNGEVPAELAKNEKFTKAINDLKQMGVTVERNKPPGGLG